ncbi:MAG: hypothetical protein WB562_05885 [Candidatus Sulfotelmatobacter sp.]
MASEMSRAAELVWRGNNTSAVRALEGIYRTSNETTKGLKRDADEQTVAFARVKEQTGALRTSFGSLLGFVGIGGVAFGLRDLKNSGVELQSQQVELRRALVSTGQDAAGAFGQLSKAAEDLSTHGGFGTTANLSALSQFVRETHSAVEAQKDLGLATDIARGRNMDLASAQNIVAQAEGGSVGRLQKILGPMVAAREAQVGLTVAHQKQIAVLQDQAAFMGKLGPIWLRQQEINDHLTAQQTALAQLTDKHATAQQTLALATKEFSGATAAYANTTEGKASNLTNSFRNLKEQLGEALLPVINRVIAAGAVLAEFLAHNKSVVLALTLGVVALTAAWGGMKILQGIKTMVVDLGRAFGITGAAGEAAGIEATAGADMATVAWRTFMTSTIVGLVIVGLVELITHWKQVEHVAVEVWQAITAAARDAIGFIVHGIKSLEQPFSDIGHFLSHPFGISLATGGVVPKYLAAGGPSGTDTVPAWLSPGERVLSVGEYASMGGEQGVQGAMGGLGGNFTIRNAQPIVVDVNGREILRAVVQQALSVAARGPTSLVGGSLQTGAPGLPV